MEYLILENNLTIEIPPYETSHNSIKCKNCGFDTDIHYVGEDILEVARKYKQCPICGHEINSIKEGFYGKYNKRN